MTDIPIGGVTASVPGRSQGQPTSQGGFQGQPTAQGESQGQLTVPGRSQGQPTSQGRFQRQLGANPPSPNSPAFKQKIPNTSGPGEDNWTSKNTLVNIQSQIRQLHEIIESMKKVSMSAKGNEQNNKCVMKKGKLKCKGGKKKKGVQDNAQQTSESQFKSLQSLFSEVSTSFSSVNQALVADIVGLKINNIITDKFEALSEELERRIASFTDTIDTKIQRIEDHLQTIIPVREDYIEGDFYEERQENESITPILDQENDEFIPIKEETVQSVIPNSVTYNNSRAGYTRKLDYQGVMWERCTLVNATEIGVQFPKPSSEPDHETKEKAKEKRQLEFEMLPPLRKLRLEVGISMTKTLLVVLGASLGLVTLALIGTLVFWLGWKQLTDPAAIAPIVMSVKRRRLSKTTASPLTVVTVSDCQDTNAKVKDAMRTLLKSEPDLRDFRRNTDYVMIGRGSQVVEGASLGYRHVWGKALIFLDSQHQEVDHDNGRGPEKGRGQRFEWQAELKDQLKAMTLDDVCKALGDIVIVVYGDPSSHLHPRGAIYNPSLIDRMPVPALRALCRVGRFLTIHTAFTLTQKVVLKHWLLSSPDNQLDQN